MIGAELLNEVPEDAAPLDGEEATSAPKGPKPEPREAAAMAFEIMVEMKARDVLWLDIEECSDLADHMLVATAASSRQTVGIALEVDRRLRAAGLYRLNIAGVEAGSWVVLDFGDFFINVMQERERRFYDLEALWADAIEVRRGSPVAELAPPVPDGDEDDGEETA